MALSNVPILSGHYDALLSGANTQETVLNQTNVNPTNFGNLFNYIIDGYAYAQPLYVPNLTVNGGTHNVVFAATEHDSVYAFDADGGGLLWQRSFLDPANGVTSVPQPDVISGDIVPEIGITGTPVIDGGTNTMYVVAKTKEVVSGVAHYVQRLHALDITTGLDRAASGVVAIGDTTIGGPDGGYTDTTSISVRGTGAGSNGTTVFFNALRESQRSALALVNGVVYIAWASHGDNGPYHGWVVGYQASDLSLQKVFNTSPYGSASGIWESGGGLGADAVGNLYFATGNGFGTGFSPGGSSSLGGGGGGLGYQGIGQSVAVTFREYTSSQIGLGVNGQFQGQVPTTGIDFNAGAQATPRHTFQATVTYDGTTLNATITDLTTSVSFAAPSQTLNIAQIVGGNTAYVGFTGGTGGLNVQQDIQTWTYTPGSGSGIDHSAGFASHADLKSNGSANFPGTVARLTPAANGQAGSVFSTSQVNVTNFSTTFTFQLSAGTNPIADGLTFTIQKNPGSWSESVLKLSTSGELTVVDYFTPTDWQTLDNQDADLGSGGTMLLPDAVGSTAHPHLFIETGKTGRMYLMDRDNLGKNNTPGPDQNLQTVTLGGPGVWGNPAFFLDQPGTGAPGSGSGLIYYWGTSAPAVAFRVTNGVVSSTPASQTTFAIGFPGGQPSISANGADPNSAIMWALRVDNFGQRGPAELMAFNAENLSQEIYSSNATGQRDQFGSSVKFTFPIVSNGHVYAGSNGVLAVFGLFPTPAAAPAAPSNLTGTPLAGGTQVQLSWTNNFTVASPATGNKIFRSQDGVNFQQIATVNRNATTFTDSNLSPATLYYYRVVATNQVGDSTPSNTAAVRTRMAASVLTIADVCVGSIDLSWTSVANDHYDVKRSTDGTTFTVIATVPASQTTFMDTGLANGTYFYQITAFSTFPEGSDTSDSNVAKATIGPININHFVSPGNPGFTDHSDMVANGSAQFTAENLLRLNNDFSQAGSAFEMQRTGIRGFTTQFQVRLHEGTQPNPADGFTFTIQANAPTALGLGGGGLGYQNITNSVAIKFDVFQNGGDPSANSTGVFINGQGPFGGINLNGTGVNLRSQSTKTITLSYDNGTQVLHETIFDPTGNAGGPATFTHDFTGLDIPGIVGADTAYVGFTGGTGGLFSLQDVLNWTYNEQEGSLPPRAPTNLQFVSVVRRDDNVGSDVTITWNCHNAYTAQNFIVERSTDGTNFSTLATIPANQMTFTDERLQPGTFYYRVRSSNFAGTSRPTNVDSVTITGGESPTVIDHGNGFTTHNDLTANGRARFTPNADPIGVFPGHQDIGTVTSRGSATFDGLGTYTLNASGGDIWNTTDEFHYVYKPLTGDGEIVARAVSIQNTDFWAKCGVMIRETLAADSKNAFMFETPSGHNEPVFQYRANAAGGSADYDNHINNLQAAPAWLRLVRLGDSFSGYWAQDLGGGLHGDWHQIGQTTTIPMATTVYVGLALTAHNNDGRINTSTFDNVAITGTTSDTLAASAARLTDGGFSEAGSVFSNNRLGATNFTTKFTFQMTPGTTSMADGLAFVIQGVGPTALGPGGGGLGYGSDTLGGPIGIAKSVAVKFDIYNNSGEGINSTGIFTDGRSPTIRQPGLSPDFPDQSINLDGSGINLASTHPFRVTLTYDGTTLTEQILDTVTSVRFTTSYVVNIPSLVGSNVAYAGFTGGTGGLTTVIDVQSWTMKSTLPRRGASGSSTLAAPELAPLTTSTASDSTPSAPTMLLARGSSQDSADAPGLSGTDEDWLDVIAATTGDTSSDSSGDELFAQLADESDLLHVLGTNGRSKS